MIVSRIKHEVARLDAHVKTLRVGCLLLTAVALIEAVGWWSAPRNLTIHNPPDLRSGSTRKWWEIPPGTVYAFTFYIFQQLNRWPADGEADYRRNIVTLANYLTPSCKAFFEGDYKFRSANNELRKRVRGVYEIPGRGYTDDPTFRVKQLATDAWQVNLDLATDEYYGSETVKRTFVRYPIRVQRLDIDPEKNPWGMVLDCYTSAPMRIVKPDAAALAAKGDGA